MTKLVLIYNKTLIKVGKKNILKLIELIYKNSTANIIINNERLNDFSLRLRISQVCPLLPNLFNIVLEVLGTAVWQEK